MLEHAFEPITSPLHRVFDLVGEVLEGADGDALLGRVAGRTIVLSEVGDDDLGREEGREGVREGGKGELIVFHPSNTSHRTWVLPFVPSVPLSSMGS